jgi:hypothetical protein
LLKSVRVQFVSSALVGAAIVIVLGAAFLFAARHGSPAWLAGQEREVFIKLALITVALTLLDVLWRVEVPIREEAVSPASQDEH